MYPQKWSQTAGRLAGVAQYPVQLNVSNKLVYSAHDYGISVYDHQDWFDTTKHPDFPANLPAVWDHFWGYIYKQNIAPVLVGEFGSTLADPRDTQWMKALVSYLGTGSSGMSFTYWSWNPDSGDTGGIVSDDWVTVNQAKQAILAPALVPPVVGGTPTSTPTASATPTSTPTSTPGACAATVQITNSWPSGFQAAVTAKNGGSATLNPWVISFTVPAGVTIGSGWNGTFTQSGTTVTVTAPTYDAALVAGATASIGFTANGTSRPAPSGVTLNGITCS